MQKRLIALIRGTDDAVPTDYLILIAITIGLMFVVLVDAINQSGL